MKAPVFPGGLSRDLQSEVVMMLKTANSYKCTECQVLWDGLTQPSLDCMSKVLSKPHFTDRETEARARHGGVCL
jgi:hypothetical protein